MSAKSNNADPLKALLTAGAASVNRDKLARLLKNYIVLDETTGEPTFLPSFGTLENPQKLEVILAAAKARSLLFSDIAEGIPASYIISLDVLPEGSCKSGLKRLFDSHKIKKDKDGYVLPNYRIDEIAEALSR